MKKLLTVLVIFIVVNQDFILAQTTFFRHYWKTPETNEFNDVKQTPDGGYIFVGGPGATNNTDGMFVVKTNASGDTIWTRSFGDHSNTNFASSHARSVLQMHDGGYVISGFTEGFYNSVDFYVIRINSFGDTLWTRTLDHPSGSDDYANAGELTSDSNFVTFGSQSLSPNYCLSKWDTTGALLWTHFYNIPGNFEFGNAVTETFDHGFFLGGQTTNDFIQHILVVKTNSLGTTQWAKVLSASGANECKAVLQCSDGGLVIAGNTQAFGIGWTNMFVIKTNAAGDTLWTRSYGAGYGDALSSIRQTPDSGYIVTGSTYQQGSFDTKALLMKLDDTGSVTWAKSYGYDTSNADWEGRCVEPTSDGGYVMGGIINSSGIGAFAIKTDAQGNSGCNDTMVTVTSTAAPFIINLVTLGNSIVTTLPQSPPTEVLNGSDYSTICLTVGLSPDGSPEPVPVSIIPNPTTGLITIQFNEMVKQGELTIYNLLGESIFYVKLENQSDASLDLTQLPKGLYLVRLLSEERNVIMKVVRE